MKHYKRILSLLLAVLMTVSMASFTLADNVTFTDISGHWATAQINYLVQKNVLNGYKQSNGTYTFQPDGQVTRAEFIKMLDETFGLTATTSIYYSDVKATDWFYPYFQKAAAQGYILNYGSSVNPNGKISREEATSLLVRYLDLAQGEKAPASTFTDYNQISDVYKDYILVAIKANLVNGYQVGNSYEFRPQGTLTRAEALTILYRAAGAIYDSNSWTRDAGAPAQNNVFTRGDIAIYNTTIEGRNIVTEGASSGNITFSNCTIPDTLIIRGKASVQLDNCKAQQIIVLGGGNVSLINQTTVQNLTVESGSSINVYSGTSINTLRVNSNATGLSISGDGNISNAIINASGLKSGIVPDNFEIANGLTAQLGNAIYTGKSADQLAFDGLPFVSTDGTNTYINVKALESGRVYAYFANTAEVPTASGFASLYSSYNYKTEFAAERGKYVTVQTYANSLVSGYSYVVLQLQQDSRRFTPVVIPNTLLNGTGFSTDPYAYDSRTINFKPAYGGTVYWYYTDSASAITPVEFLNAYDAKEAALKGSKTVTASNTLSCALNDKYVENYRYVAFMLRTSAGVCGTPVVVSAGETGFAELPTVKTAGVITFKANTKGDLYYYYSETDKAPAPDRFRTEYNAARYYSNGSISVRANTADEFKYDTSLTSRYPYLVIAIRDSNGDYLTPVVLNIDVKTGFKIAPSVVSSTTIRFTTDIDGRLKYYYTRSSSAPSVSEFNSNFDAARSGYYGNFSVRADLYDTIEYNSSYASSYPYMAIMLTDSSGKEYAPVLVELSNALTTGFTVNPYVKDGRVYFKTSDDGEVFYYYTTSSSAVSADDFYDEFYDTSSDYRYTMDVTGNRETSFAIDSSASKRNDYIVLAFRPKDAKTRYEFSYPYVLDIYKSESDTSMGTGIKTHIYRSDEIIEVTASYDGKLYYYLTDDEDTLPSSASTFERRYDSARHSGSFNISKGDYKDVVTDGYDYAVLCLMVNNKYLEPVIIDMRNGKEYSGDTDGSTVTGTGFTDVNVSTTDMTVSFTPKVSGTVKLLVRRDSTFYDDYEEVAKVDVTAGVTAKLNLPTDDWISVLYKGSSYYLQLTSGSDKYQVYKILTIGN